MFRDLTSSEVQAPAPPSGPAGNWSIQQLTVEAPDGPRALDTWDAHPGEIDLLLTDDVISRHGMDGLRLVQKPVDAQTLLGAVRSALDA